MILDASLLSSATVGATARFGCVRVQSIVRIRPIPSAPTLATVHPRGVRCHPGGTASGSGNLTSPIIAETVAGDVSAVKPSCSRTTLRLPSAPTR